MSDSKSNDRESEMSVKDDNNQESPDSVKETTDEDAAKEYGERREERRKSMEDTLKEMTVGVFT